MKTEKEIRERIIHWLNGMTNWSRKNDKAYTEMKNRKEELEWILSGKESKEREKE